MNKKLIIPLFTIMTLLAGAMAVSAFVWTEDAGQEYAMCNIVGIVGDIDEDGVVNVLDVLYALDVSIGTRKIPDNITMAIDCMDVNQDGEITVIDAQMIARYSAGLEVSFPIGERYPIFGEVFPVKEEIYTIIM